MFKNRKPKIIASYEEEEEEEAVPSFSIKTTNNESKTSNSRFKKKSLKLGNTTNNTVTNNLDKSSNAEKDNSKGRNTEIEDLETIVIKPRKNTGFGLKSTSNTFSSKPKQKKTLHVFPPNESPVKFSSTKKLQYPNHESDLGNEENTQNSNADRLGGDTSLDVESSKIAVQSAGLQIHDDDMDMKENYYDNSVIDDDHTINPDDGNIFGPIPIRSDKKVKFLDEEASMSSPTPSNSLYKPSVTSLNTMGKVSSITSTLLTPLSNTANSGSKVLQYEYPETLDTSADFIPLDPKTVNEEKNLMEARLYNEYDMEEGVEMLDEDLALDEQAKERQRRWKRLMMEKAIDLTEAEKLPDISTVQPSAESTIDEIHSDNENEAQKAETDMWERNQLMNSVVYGHTELEQQKSMKALSSNTNNGMPIGSKPREISSSSAKSGKTLSTEIPPLPSFDTVMSCVQNILTTMHNKQKDLDEEIMKLNEETKEIGKKQELTQQKLDEAGKKYESIKKNEEAQVRDQDGDLKMTDNVPEVTNGSGEQLN